jgi:hypothetical protein
MAESLTGARISSSGARAAADLEPDLVVALAGAAVGDRVRPPAPGLLDQQLGDQRPRQGRHQRVAALVEGVGSHRRDQELGREAVPAVHHHGVGRSGGQGPLGQGRQVLTLADVGQQGDHGATLLVDQPVHGHGRVQPARVGEHHEVGGGSGHALAPR